MGFSNPVSFWNSIPPGIQKAAGIGALATVGRFLPGRPPVGGGVGRSGGVNTLVKQRNKPQRRRKSFRQKMIASEPAKHYTVSTVATPMLHDTIFNFNITAGVVQGTANPNRLGDSIDIAALKVKGQYFTAAAANAYCFRLIIGWSGEENGATTWASSFGSGDLFLPGTIASGLVDGIINAKAFTMLHDETIDVNSNIVTTRDGASFGFTIPIDQRFVYQSTASTFGKVKNLMVIAIGDVNGGVVGTTDVGTCRCSVDLIFK